MTLDPFELARAEEMLRGYSARWFDEPLEWLAVEVETDAPLLNPDTGAASRTFLLGGKLDAIARHIPTGDVLVVERKTSSEDLSPGSAYWKRLTLASQLSTYMALAKASGYEPRKILYDVLGKPGIRPSAVPIVEDGAKVVLDANGARVRTKDGKKWRETADSAHGYVLQTRPETVDEFRVRLRDVIVEKVDDLFHRADVVRLADDERDAAFDAWQTAENIREGRRAQRFPRNSDACIRYNQPCTFLPVCAREASLEDATRYRRVENVHEELSDRKTRLPLLTNSEMGTHNACKRLHHLRYDLGYRALVDAEVQRFGTLVHAGLEAWTLAVKDGAPESECVDRAIEMMRTPPKPAVAKTAPITREAIVL